MADPFASPDDLAKRWRPLTDAEKTTAEVLLEDASIEVRAALKRAGIDTTDDFDTDAAKVVVCGMVKRSMIAGDTAAGVTTAQETTGPFSRSFTYANPTGDLYMTKRERQMLGIGLQTVFTVPMESADG
ncbi:Gp19/Gp15/Gp42 family protein [Curtobacterium sp. MCLR17_036]|uniref:Gp19/Gp15/Gp42 family protein n=1 Tax=Curtobacterium sp. MCLR17_036 TaxID=2175620 RepID=UPI000DA8F162|nr:Gp19/Gp15/Gp42 family protein [Curtobacterium sp. MCLR17_036]WIE65950.1 Gp19/Gp15/Gp42 family protein [Curtobacterium sp. MCLR17_036]